MGYIYRSITFSLIYLRTNTSNVKDEKDLPSHLETTIEQSESYRTSLRFIKGARWDVNPGKIDFLNILWKNSSIEKYISRVSFQFGRK